MGVQEELSQPVAVLLNEDSDTLAIASAAGFRCFTDTKSFKRYVRREVLAADGQDWPLAASSTSSIRK
jgi:hypothetical protein